MDTSQRDSGSHLDDLALDALRAGKGTPENAAHVEGCPCCRAALSGMAGIEARLKAAQPPIPAVPLQVETRIFRAYREAIAPREPVSFPATLRRWTLPVAGLAAAAAAVMLTLRLSPPDESRQAFQAPPRMVQTPAPRAASEAPPFVAAVDIVDAFLLARALRDGAPVPPGSDADGDGIVGGADVQTLARRAVAL